MKGPLDDAQHRRLALEIAALEAVGALSAADDDSWVGHHLASGCEVCRAAADRVALLFDDLLLAADPVEPPTALRARLLQRVRSESEGEASQPRADEIQVWNRWVAGGPDAFTTLPAADAVWEATAVPGIVVRALHVDEDRDLVTMLIRMEPGASYPRHRHAAGEHCYVLRGDLGFDGQVLRAGDYHFAPAGTIHGDQSTVGGCTLLIVSSRSDQLLN